jgi:TonB family protein
MENFAKFDDFGLQVGPFGTAEPQVGPGFEWLLRRPVDPIDAKNCRFTSTATDPKHGPPSWVGSFVYVDGRFRFAGGTYPFWSENSVASEKKSPTLPTVTSFECPKYPPEAKAARLQGMVRLQITTDGHGITDVKVSGHPLIAPAASQNVRTWKFTDHPPITLNVTYSYVLQGEFKRDPVTKCPAKMELPTRVTVSTSP